MAELELMIEMTFNMYQVVSLLSLAVVGHGSMFSPNNPSKEKEILKGQHDLALNEWNRLPKKLVSLVKDMETHDVPFELASTVSSLNESLEESYRDFIDNGNVLGVVQTYLTNSETG